MERKKIEEKKLERKVGDEFFSGFYGKSYKVCRPKVANKCVGCAFSKHKQAYIAENSGVYTCNGLLEETGECIARKRSDGQDVIFKEVEVCKR